MPKIRRRNWTKCIRRVSGLSGGGGTGRNRRRVDGSSTWLRLGASSTGSSGGGSMDYSTPIKSDRCHSLPFSRFIHLCRNSGCRNNWSVLCLYMKCCNASTGVGIAGVGKARASRYRQLPDQDRSTSGVFSSNKAAVPKQKSSNDLTTTSSVGQLPTTWLISFSPDEQVWHQRKTRYVNESIKSKWNGRWLNATTL